MTLACFPSLLQEAGLWWVIFALTGAPVEELSAALSTLAFSLLVSFTMPMQLVEVRTVLTEHLWEKGSNKANDESEYLKYRGGETLTLFAAILLGAVFTQLDWAVWFQRWPVPSFVLFSVVRIFLVLLSGRNRKPKAKHTKDN
uniref:Uncharacterized protein n=1 Tax=Trypanosoma congolense (strain IL3000) TaxID=1068625 RepID=G0UXX5_TRYCI|nr:conserved hypothetical protein [Trypanosoma congolense IL3000]